MKKNVKKLALSRESLRRLGDGELRALAGGTPVTGECAYTLQVACVSNDVHTCYTCTVV